MKLNSSIALFAAAAIILTSCTDKKGGSSTTSTSTSTTPAAAGSGHYAYIDIDTFQASYILLKNKKKDFSAREESMQNELQRSAQQLQSDAADFQKKAQDGKMSQSEGEAAQKKLAQMQQSLETRKQSMEAEFVKDQDAFNMDLHNKMETYLGKLSQERHYDFVFSYSKTNPNIIYANKGLDITQEVIKGMNAEQEGKK